MCEGKQKWKQRERDREGKQVNANRKQELALINRKVSTFDEVVTTRLVLSFVDSKCVTWFVES